MTEPLEPDDEGERIRSLASLYVGFEHSPTEEDDDDWEVRWKKRQLAELEALAKGAEAEIAVLRAELRAEPEGDPEEAQVIELRPEPEADDDKDGD